jgi:O-antigen ligase
MGSLKTHWRDLQIEAYQRFPLKSHFHSSPIQIAVERGLLTLAAWLWLLAGYFRVLARLVRSTVKNDWYLRGITVGLVSSACAFLLGSLTDYSWGDSEVVMVFWMFLGWALALDRLLDRVNDQAEIAPAKDFCIDSLIFSSFCATLGHGYAEGSPTRFCRAGSSPSPSHRLDS